MSQTSDDVRLARIERVGVSAAAVTLVGSGLSVLYQRSTV